MNWGKNIVKALQGALVTFGGVAAAYLAAHQGDLVLSVQTLVATVAGGLITSLVNWLKNKSKTIE